RRKHGRNQSSSACRPSSATSTSAPSPSAAKESPQQRPDLRIPLHSESSGNLPEPSSLFLLLSGILCAPQVSCGYGRSTLHAYRNTKEQVEKLRRGRRESGDGDIRAHLAILVVDDNPHDIILVTSYLEEITAWTVRVFPAETVEEA